MNKTLVVVGSVLGIVATAWVATKLLGNPEQLRRRPTERSRDDWLVDIESEDSFPASDAPSFTPVTSLGSVH